MQPAKPERIPFRVPIWLIVAGGTALLVLALMGLWKLKVTGPIAARLAAYRAAGEPITAADLSSRGGVSPDRNAAEFLRRASQALHLEKTADDLLQKGDLSDPANVDVRRAAVQANQEALDLIRAARMAPDVDWGLQVVSPLNQLALPHLREMRALARFVSAAAVDDLERGDSAAALAKTRDIVRMAGAVGSDSPGLIGHLVQVAVVAIATDSLESAGLCLDLNDQKATQEADHLRIELLAVRKNLEKELIHALNAERADLLETLESATGGSALGPAVMLGGAEALDLFTTIRDASAEPSYAAVRSALPELPSSHVPALMYASMIGETFGGTIELSFRGRTAASLAATSLAIRLAEARTGHRIRELMELPADLGPIPPDPYEVDLRPLKLVTRNGCRLLYSIGADGEDQLGTYVLNQRGDVDQHQLDLVYFLDESHPQRAAPPPSAEDE